MEVDLIKLLKLFKMNEEHKQLHSNFDIKDEVEAELESEPSCHAKQTGLQCSDLCREKIIIEKLHVSKVIRFSNV